MEKRVLLKAPTGQQCNLSLCPIVTGDDGCLLWDVKEAACTACLEGPAVRWASCVDDGKQLLCASGNRTTKLWDFQSNNGKVALEGNRGSRVKSWSASEVKHTPWKAAEGS